MTNIKQISRFAKLLNVKPVELNRVAFLGLGNMAKKMILSMQAHNKNQALIHGYSPSQRQLPNVLTHKSITATLDNQLSYVIYAFKPKNWDENLKKTINQALENNKQRPIIISILAGLGIDELNCDIVIMPNVLCEVEHNYMFAHAKDTISAEQKLDIEKLCEHMGPISWVDSADKMHLAVASSGSAPAYVLFAIDKAIKMYTLSGLSENTARKKVITAIKSALELFASELDSDNIIIWSEMYKLAGNNHQHIFILKFIEAYCHAMLKLGLDIKTASQVAWHTVFGTTLLVEKYPEIEINSLMESIMSKGGTTEQAIAVAKSANFDIFTSQKQLNSFVLSMLKAAYDQSIYLKEQSKKKSNDLEVHSIFKAQTKENENILTQIHKTMI